MARSTLPKMLGQDALCVSFCQSYALGLQNADANALDSSQSSYKKLRSDIELLPKEPRASHKKNLRLHVLSHFKKFKTSTIFSAGRKSISSSMFSADDNDITPRGSSRVSSRMSGLPGQVEDDEVWDDNLSDSGFGLPVMEKRKGERFLTDFTRHQILVYQCYRPDRKPGKTIEKTFKSLEFSQILQKNLELERKNRKVQCGKFG